MVIKEIKDKKVKKVILDLQAHKELRVLLVHKVIKDKKEK